MNKRLRKDYCGVLGWRPQWIQKFATVQSFTFFASIIVAIQGIYLGYFIGIITTIEKRFQMTSAQSGALLSAYDVGHALSVLLVGHYGFWFHKSKWIGIGGFVSTIACFGLALPHLIFGGYDQPQLQSGSQNQIDVSLCNQNMTAESATTSSTIDEINANITSNNNYIAYVMLVIFQIVCGLASSPFTTLTFVYIDDNATKTQSPFYLGVMTAMWSFGPALGFGLAALCAQFFVTLGDPPVGVSSQSASWISAWWLGLVILSILYFVFSFPFFFFPKSLKRIRTLSQRDPDVSSVELLALEDLTTANSFIKIERDTTWCLKYFAQIPLEVYHLIRNPIFVCIALFWIFWAYIFGGYSTFLPKYLETQFYQRTSSANVYGGLIAITGVAIATPIGGKILSFFNPKPFKAFLLLFFTTAACVINFLVLIAIKCPNELINGMNLDQLNSALSNNVTSPTCTQFCTCNSELFDPVCANGAVFYSPCFAGCSSANHSSDSIKYESCICSSTGVAEAGYCPDPCGSKMILYLFATFLSGFIGSIFQMATVTNLLWCVPVNKKTIALALANFFTSFLGFMPSQVIYGRIIDTSCSVWSGNENTPNRYCLIYNNDDFRLNYHISTAAFQFLCLICVGFACYFSRTFKFHSDREIVVE